MEYDVSQLQAQIDALEAPLQQWMIRAQSVEALMVEVTERLAQAGDTEGLRQVLAIMAQHESDFAVRIMEVPIAIASDALRRSPSPLRVVA